MLKRRIGLFLQLNKKLEQQPKQQRYIKRKLQNNIKPPAQLEQKICHNQYLHTISQTSPAAAATATSENAVFFLRRFLLRIITCSQAQNL